MGEYLFSEPVAATKIMLVDDAEAAVKSVSDASSLLINIPKNLTRKQIDKALDNNAMKSTQEPQRDFSFDRKGCFI